jgi:hypothetical protein
MGTRGAFGFRIDGEDKLAYNQYDSYPTGLGLSMIVACKTYPFEQLLAAADSLEVIDSSKPPTEEQKQKCREAGTVNLGVSNQSEDDWYCLLRNAQGDIDSYVQGKVPFLDNSAGFLKDSLFCEWAYIINIDDKTLEIYKGFNKNPKAPGRYAALSEPGNSGYYGVRLFRTLALSELYKSDIDAEKLAEQIEEQASEEEAEV